MVLLQLVSFRYLAAKQERFCQRTTPANLERSKVLIPVAFGDFWTGINPKPELIQIGDADRAVAHSINQMLPDTLWKILPLPDLWHQPPKTMRPN